MCVLGVCEGVCVCVSASYRYRRTPRNETIQLRESYKYSMNGTSQDTVFSVTCQVKHVRSLKMLYSDRYHSYLYNYCRNLYRLVGGGVQLYV